METTAPVGIIFNFKYEISYIAHTASGVRECRDSAEITDSARAIPFLAPHFETN